LLLPLPALGGSKGFAMHRADDVSSEVQDLVWALVDEQATADQIRRLEAVLLEDGEARRVYVTCMQMHADLHYLLGGMPRLAKILEKAIEEERKGASAALPIVDRPPIVANVPMVDGLAS
jgi:hypothetical protein